MWESRVLCETSKPLWDALCAFHRVAASRARLPGWEDHLEPGDIIHAMNGTPVTSLAGLREALGAPKAGQAVVLHVAREGSLVHVAGRVE